MSRALGVIKKSWLTYSKEIHTYGDHIYWGWSSSSKPTNTT
jgi:hypothetical protein